MFVELRTVVGLLLIVGLALSGCDSSSNTGGGKSMDEMAAAVSAQKSTEQQKQQQSATSPQAATAQTTPERKVVGRPPVESGGGYYSAIIGARRHILNEAESWAWKQGVSHFKATNGRKPKDHKEFMEKVINVKDYEIQLPPLQPNEEYLYDPAGETDGDFGQLFVVEKQPAPQKAPGPSNAPTPK